MGYSCLGLPIIRIKGLRAEHCEFGGGDNDCGEARILNSGQSCIAAKPFIVTEAIADKLEKLFAEKMAALKVGDPFYEKTELGPGIHKHRWGLKRHRCERFAIR